MLLLGIGKCLDFVNVIIINNLQVSLALILDVELELVYMHAINIVYLILFCSIKTYYSKKYSLREKKNGRNGGNE